MIQSIMNSGTAAVNSAANQVGKETSGKEGFGKVLKSAIEQLNESQHASDVKTEALANGNVNDLHDVMIAAQKASITLETAVQIQKKAIDAYNEVMRMQV